MSDIDDIIEFCEQHPNVSGYKGIRAHALRIKTRDADARVRLAGIKNMAINNKGMTWRNALPTLDYIANKADELKIILGGEPDE